MARITGTLGRPIQGISQQPNNTRLDGQCEDSVNLRPDVVRGLVTRTGAEWITELPFKPDVRDKWFHYSRDEVEEYFINIPYTRADGIKIFDKHGVQCTISNAGTDEFNSILDYIYGSEATEANVKQLLSGVTIGDTTIIANSAVTVQPSGQLSPENKRIGVVYCQFMDYGQTQGIKINGTTVAEYKSPDGSQPSHKEKVDTSYVTEELFKALTATGGGEIVKKATFTPARGSYYGATIYYISQTALDALGVGGRHKVVSFYNKSTSKPIQADFGNSPFKNSWYFSTKQVNYDHTIEVSYMGIDDTGTAGTFSATRNDNVIFISMNDGSDFTLDTFDGADGGNLIAVKDTVTDISKLPPKAPQDMVVKIAPKNGNVDEEYYLRSQWNNEDGSDMQWVESAAPNLELGVLASTMPFSIIRDTYDPSGSTFEVKLIEWDSREVGNDKTNPQPAFVGNQISAVSLFQNRLLLGSGETVSLSRSSDFFNYYKTTTQAVLDTDPYEVYSDSTEVISLKNPIPFNGDVLFFTETAQMSLSGAEVVSPNKPTPLRQVSAFETQPHTAPVAAGENIFFAFDYGRFTGIREFFTDSITDTKRARPITDHVNRLLEGKVRHMATSTSINTLAVVCEEDPDTLFMYDWMWQGSEKVQSAWGKWHFEDDTVIHFFEFNKSFLYMVYERNGKSCFIKFDLGQRPDNLGGNAYGITFAIDHKKRVTFTRENAGFSAPASELDNLIGLDDNRDLVLGIQASGYDADIGTATEMYRAGDKFYLTLTHEELPDDTQSVEVITGLRISVSYTPSNPYAKDQDGSARSDFDRLQMGRIAINYDSAGICEARVQTYTGYDRILQLAPRIIGNANNIVGFARPEPDTFRVAIRTRANQYKLTLTSSSHLPLQIRELEFDGTYNRRGRSV